MLAHQYAKQSMLDFMKTIEEVKSWVYEAGEMQKANLGKKMIIDTKSSGVDLVTRMDRDSEDYLLDKIRRNCPGHAILSEESGQDSMESEYLWIVDPLDGTTNYAQGLPIFAISIALQYRRRTELGVIYVPVLGQMFSAIKGQGAFLNDIRAQVSCKEELQESVLATGFPYDRAEHPDNNVNYFARITPQVRGIRRMGSAACDLAYVSAGWLDGYWELNLSPWDVAVGVLMVEEAGGKVLYLSEKRGISLIAGNRVMCQKILQEIKITDAIDLWIRC